MNKILVLSTICLLISVSLVKAQMPIDYIKKDRSDANIVGHVKCNGEHVPFVNVTIDGTMIGTTTDNSGHFQLIDLPVEPLTLRVSGMGYRTKTQLVQMVEGETKEIKFEVAEDILHVDEVVVSADRNQTTRAEAPVIITSISPKIFDVTQSLNIAEGLCFTPGLRTECNCQNCGFTQLRINGMEGSYTQILMNSRPVFSGLAGVYGLELIPANMVERLEVIRGGGSALFGGNAIAGSVNIITKEAKRNTFSLDARTSLIGVGSHEGIDPAMDSQLSFNASMVSNDGKAGGYIYGLMRNKDPYDENGDGFSESVLIDNNTMGFSTYYKTGVRSKITLNGYRINEFRRGGNKFELLAHETDITEQVRHLITGGNLAFDLFFDNNDKLSVYAAGQTVQRDTYYGAEKDPNAYGHTDDIIATFGAQYVMQNEELFGGNATTIFGIDDNMNLIDDVKLGTEDDYLISPITNQLVNTVGAFAQHNWKSQHFNLSLGLRYDIYSITNQEGEYEDADYQNKVLAPRIGLMYKLNPENRIRIGYAKGYRAPQVFNEDLHIELINAKRVVHKNSPDLVEETSQAFTLSYNTNFVFASGYHDVLIEGFNTILLNAFADEYTENTDVPREWYYERKNADGGATVNGVNFELNSVFTDLFEIQLGFTYQTSLFDKPQAWGEAEDAITGYFLRSPDTYGYATFTFNPLHHLKTSLTLNHTGSMYVPHFGLEEEDYYAFLADGTINEGDVIVGERLEKTENFLIADFLLSYDIDISKETSIQLYGGIKNIFNQTQKSHDSGVYRDAGYIYGPCQLRTINLGLKFGNY